MASATSPRAVASSVRLRDVTRLDTRQQVATAVFAVNLVLGGVFLAVYPTQNVMSANLLLAIAGGNLGVATLGLHKLTNWLQEVSA